MEPALRCDCCPLASLPVSLSRRYGASFTASFSVCDRFYEGGEVAENQTQGISAKGRRLPHGEGGKTTLLIQCIKGGAKVLLWTALQSWHVCMRDERFKD